MSLGAAGLGQRSEEGRGGGGSPLGTDSTGEAICKARQSVPAGHRQTDGRTGAKPERNERSRTVREREREG